MKSGVNTEMPRSASDGQLPERLQHPRTEAQEAAYWYETKSRRELLSRIRGVLTISQCEKFLAYHNAHDVDDVEIAEAIAERVQELREANP